MKRLTPMRAIRQKCLDCTCYQPKVVRERTTATCALWPYRLGKRPVKVDDGQAISEVGND